MTKIHYAGEIWDHIGLQLAGWAACCSGDQAVKIRGDGNHTYDRSLVTCKRCLYRIKTHDAAHAKDPSIEAKWQAGRADSAAAEPK